MTCQFLLPAFVAILVMISASTPAWAADLFARIDPEDEPSRFSIEYQKTISIEYPEDGLRPEDNRIHGQLNGNDWQVTGFADSANPGVQDLTDQMNRNILDSGSQASISDLVVSYDVHLKPFDGHMSIDYDILIRGKIYNYTIARDPQITLIDLGWRGLSAHDEVVIDGVEINLPISILESHSPGMHDILAGTEADEILLQPIINADRILEQPMADWHFRIDRPITDQGLHGGKAAEFVLSKWALGGFDRWQNNDIEAGTQVTVTLDQEYTVKSKQTVDGAIISVWGYGKPVVLDGVEVLKVTPTMPEWVRIVVSYWADGIISDSTFINCMQYIIENGVVHVSSVPLQPDPVSVIPDRVRTNLSHWANGSVPDSMFIGSMHFLIKNDIIHIQP